MFFKKFFQKFLPAHKFIQKKLVVVIPSYNNQEWYQKNLDSVFNQNYKNYRIIYIDDASTDKTGELVEKYVKEKKQNHRVSLIKNTSQEGATANRYKGSHLCEDDEVVLILDGDDWLAHNNVMQVINKTYSCDDIWLTYGQFIRWPSGEIGQCKKLPQNYNYRTMKHWYTSALRTYYAWLFKKINRDDLMYEGKFFQVSGDVAEMLPMLEMARRHTKFIKKILYIYNNKTPFNDFKKHSAAQLKLFKYIQSKKKHNYKNL